MPPSAFENHPGISFTVAIGRWSGIYFVFSRTALRLVLGFAAVTIWFCDIEKGWKELADYLRK